ncbi:hypothetical protein BJY01DRAFT_213702 [Aspergillus pseudoustus]|uniref:Uncharacterized protein n=1 Tax=Aspergillus pseudoustus TaxID=1810923 RepID=A0ABR4K1P7_9EURO
MVIAEEAGATSLVVRTWLLGLSLYFGLKPLGLLYLNNSAHSPCYLHSPCLIRKQLSPNPKLKV